MGEILDLEKPDLVVHTGDFLDAQVANGPGWDAKYWTIGVQPMVDRGISWAVAMGNHDGHGDLTRDQLAEFDRSFPLSMTQPNALNITDKPTNYILNVLGQTGDDEVKFRMWFLDTGNRDCLGSPGFGCVWPEQVEWFRQQNFAI